MRRKKCGHTKREEQSELRAHKINKEVVNQLKTEKRNDENHKKHTVKILLLFQES